MNEILIFLLSLMAFWLAIYALDRILHLKRYGFKVKPLFIKWESGRFRALLYRFSGRLGRMWRALSYVYMFIGFGLMALTLALLSWNLVRGLLPHEAAVAVAVLVPGLTLRLYWLPYFLVAVVVTIIVHEAAHGIAALREGVGIKSAGAFLFAMFPGGFVELDGVDLKRAPRASRIKIFSAGSASNLLAGLLVLLLMLGLFAQSPSGIIATEVLEGGPLHSAGVRSWDIIYALNGTGVYTQRDIADFMSRVKPGDRIIVKTSRGDFIVTAAPSPEEPLRPILGLASPIPYYPSRLRLCQPIDIHLYLVLNWLFLVLFSVAAFNMLPIPLFDGDRVIQCLLEGAPGAGSAIKGLLNTISIFLIIANVVIPGV